MFADCVTDKEKNEYKRSGKLKKESDEYYKVQHPDFYQLTRLGSYNDVFDQICNLIKIPEQNGRFLYFIDPFYLFDTTRGYRFENFTPDYSKILHQGLENLKYPESQISNSFCLDYNRTIDSLIKLTKRIVKSCSNKQTRYYFTQLIGQPSTGLEEALQRILFINQMFWQMGHRLVGLGHLDILLFPYYQADMAHNKLDRDGAYQLIKDFLIVLHENYWLKSNVLMGDTGQIIILGQSDAKGNYQYNELTTIFIEAVMELQNSEPKVLLRVTDKIPRVIMELAVSCMQTGIGSPILANDQVIIPKLISYGLTEAEAFLYGTSACWEPLIPGKSISPNNIACLVYPHVLQNVLERECDDSVSSFSLFLKVYYKELLKELDKIQNKISEYRFQYNPLLSVFMSDCYERKADVSSKGARYCNYGITTVGIANTVDSLLNINKYVYKEHRYTLGEVKHILSSNYQGQEKLRVALVKAECRFGMDTQAAILLTNDILYATTEYTKNYKNYLGGGMKFGLSAPGYVDTAKDFPATFDGRKKGEAFRTHISADYNNGYTEIVNFAAALDYNENRINGNVVDFMVSPSFLQSHYDKFIDFMMTSISVGFYELQMNVTSSCVLIEAKKHPDKYSQLIVRVWGFSAYFCELPIEYQDALIKRALVNEGKEFENTK